MTLDECDAVHTCDGTGRGAFGSSLNRTPTGRALPDAQLVRTDRDDVALHQLPAAAGLGLSVDADRTLGEQHLGVGSCGYDIGELEELPEPDDVVPGRNVAHGPIIAHPSASAAQALERIQTETCAGCTDR